MANELYSFDINEKAEIIRYVAAREAELQAQIDNINAWATALATKLNADFTAQNLLNAFPLTLDTNYDTDPQA